jgi:cytochrome c biogenesis protein CcmG, thiol:disulfide interchange protein DsbE
MPKQPAKPTRNQPVPERRIPLVPIVLVGVAVLAVVAVMASRGGDEEPAAEDSSLEQTRPVRVTGAALPEATGPSDPAVGAAAPELAGASFAGDPVGITNDGRAKVLVFLAHWCPHCQREVPVLARWLRENGQPDGVNVYGVATGTRSDRPNYPPSEWLKRERWTQPTLADDASQSAARAYGLSGYPYFVAIDASGKVVARTSGELTTAQFEALLDRARGR